MAVPYSDVSPFVPNRLYLNGGEATFDRALISNNTANIVGGAVQLLGFTALRTEVCNNIVAYTVAQAAAATPTLCRMGVYQQDQLGNLTLLSATANDTTLFSTINTRWVRSITPQFNKVAGTAYCLAFIVVSTFTLPQLAIGTQNGNFGALLPALMSPPLSSVRIIGQTDLPLTISPGLYNACNNFFMEVLP